MMGGAGVKDAIAGSSWRNNEVETVLSLIGKARKGESRYNYEAFQATKIEGEMRQQELLGKQCPPLSSYSSYCLIGDWHWQPEYQRLRRRVGRGRRKNLFDSIFLLAGSRHARDVRDDERARKKRRRAEAKKLSSSTWNESLHDRKRPRSG